MCRPSIAHTAFILASVLDADLTVHSEPLPRAGRTLATGGTAKYNEYAEGPLIAALNKERKRASVWVEEAMSSGLLEDGVTREDAEAMAEIMAFEKVFPPLEEEPEQPVLFKSFSRYTVRGA